MSLLKCLFTVATALAIIPAPKALAQNMTGMCQVLFRDAKTKKVQYLAEYSKKFYYAIPSTKPIDYISFVAFENNAIRVVLYPNYIGAQMTTFENRDSGMKISSRASPNDGKGQAFTDLVLEERGGTYEISCTTLQGHLGRREASWQATEEPNNADSESPAAGWSAL